MPPYMARIGRGIQQLEGGERPADRGIVHVRLRSERGFGLIELLMAMVMLNIGILAIVAAYNSSIFALNRASRVSTAAALADSQMELYRALTYDAVGSTRTAFPASTTPTSATPRSAARAPTRPPPRSQPPAAGRRSPTSA